MIQFSFIKGFRVGLEYTDSSDWGFVIVLDLGLLRIMWFKDMVVLDDDFDPED